jgi:hypothetical protein
MAARLPRPLIPTARGSLSVVLALSVVGAVLGLLGTPSPTVPSFSVSLPSLPATNEPAPAGNESLRAALPRLDDVLPLARDLTPVAGALEPLSNSAAAAGWPDPQGARGRLDGWGRTGGYQVVFNRPDASTSDSPVVYLRADVSAFRSPDGARDALRDTQERLTKAGAKSTSIATFGDASFAFAQEGGSLTTYQVFIRRGATTVWLTIIGVTTSLKAEGVERLAKTLADRLG